MTTNMPVSYLLWIDSVHRVRAQCVVGRAVRSQTNTIALNVTKYIKEEKKNIKFRVLQSLSISFEFCLVFTCNQSTQAARSATLKQRHQFSFFVFCLYIYNMKKLRTTII